MAIYFYDDLDGVAKSIQEEIKAMPISRYDARAFIWQDAFFEGNYCNLPSESKGSPRERRDAYNFLKNYHADKSHFNNFEVELDGERLHDYFVFEGQLQQKTPEGFELHTVTLGYPDKQIKVHVCTLLDGTYFLTRWLEIENEGQRPVKITGIFPMAGILYAESLANNFRAEHLRPTFKLGTFKDNYYLAEGELTWMDIPKATIKLAHEHPMFNPPTFYLRDDVSCMNTVISIETSMMTQAEFTACGDYCFSRNITNQDYLHFKVGADKRATLRTVEPGERVVSPKIHIGQMYGDLDACVNAYNEHLRASVVYKREHSPMFPVKYHINAPDCKQIDKAYLKASVDRALKFDVDMVVMDAGWFGSCKGEWWRQRGDWYETEYLEDGMAEIFAYAKSKGLMCGLWMEAEGMDMASELAKAHPEWFVKAYGRNIPTLNLMLPEVRKYVYDNISGAIEKYDLDLFRIDGGLKEPSEERKDGWVEQTSWKYYEYLYEIIDSLRKKYPHVYFENCSGGGGRSDLAIMRRFDWMQATDSFSPAAQLRVIYGMSYAFPPEWLMAINSSCYMYNDADFFARSCLLSIVDFILGEDKDYNEELCRAWNKAIKIYKEHIRPILPTSKIWHHTPVEPYMERGSRLCWELSSPDKKKAVLGVFRLAGGEADELVVKPRGISRGKNYEVYFDNDECSCIVSGHELTERGLTVKLGGRLTSEVIVISAVD